MNPLGVTASDALASALEYDRDGAVVSRRSEARSRPGTTVAVAGLFEPLPVRRKEFVRNKKREFAKLVHLVQAYCLVSKGVRCGLLVPCLLVK